MPDRKIVLEGTHRARTPADTWDIIEPLLPSFGISRVADVTGLDCVGIPVYVAVRPGSETLAVSQGKGATPDLAKVSAAMEAIELWHAERPATRMVQGTPEAMCKDYPIEALSLRDAAAIWRGMTLRWCVGTGILSGAPVPVPADVVEFSLATGHDWKPDVFVRSTTGLASGNTQSEASLHGLYEIIERDVLNTLTAGGRQERRYLDRRTVRVPHLADFFGKLDRAGVTVEVAMIPNEYDLPVAVAYVWSPEYPVVCGGAGCHSDPAVALSRAVSEAVQSRLTEISGTRDDIESFSDVFTATRDDAGFEPGGEEWDRIVDGAGFAETSLARELDIVARRVAKVTGYEPVVVDLSSSPEAFSVVKVIAPGARDLGRGDIPR